MKINSLLAVVCAVGVFCFAMGAMADELSSDTTAGAASQSEGLNFSAKDSSPWSWNAGYAYTHLSQTDPVAGNISDSTHQFTGGFDWEHDWTLGAGLSYSTTPSEHLTSAGPNFQAGYTWKFGEETQHPAPEIRRKEEQQLDVNQSTSERGVNPHVEQEPEAAANEPFRPSVGLKSSIAFLSYKESFPGFIPTRPGRPTKPTNTTEQITQTGWTWELDISPVEWLGFKSTYTHFFYNRDVQHFLSLLDNPRAVSLGVSGFSNTLDGFQTNEETVEFMLYPAEMWEADFEASLAKSATDGTHTRGVQVMGLRELGEHWKTGLGYEYDNGEGLVQSAGIFNVTYMF